jgi:hypothetical protein
LTRDCSGHDRCAESDTVVGSQFLSHCLGGASGVGAVVWRTI